MQWLLLGQELEKREHNKRKAEKEEKQSQPGFDGRWYTDTDSHLTNRIKYEFRLYQIIMYSMNGITVENTRTMEKEQNIPLKKMTKTRGAILSR